VVVSPCGLRDLLLHHAAVPQAGRGACSTDSALKAPLSSAASCSTSPGRLGSHALTLWLTAVEAGIEPASSESDDGSRPDGNPDDSELGRLGPDHGHEVGGLLVYEWELQGRGVWHLHFVLGMETPVERVWAFEYVKALRELGPSKGFGDIDAKPLHSPRSRRRRRATSASTSRSGARTDQWKSPKP